MGALAPVGPLPEPPLEERELRDKMRLDTKMESRHVRHDTDNRKRNKEIGK